MLKFIIGVLVAILAISQLSSAVLRTREARMSRMEVPFRDLAAPAPGPTQQ
jgi:hypothetical protein